MKELKCPRGVKAVVKCEPSRNASLNTPVMSVGISEGNTCYVYPCKKRND